MKKSILNLEGVQVLSRNEQKSVNGGLARGCKLVIANANGTYTTLTGTCVVPVTMEMDAMGHVWPVASGPAFCDTGDGVAHTLSSNGGVSRC